MVHETNPKSVCVRVHKSLLKDLFIVNTKDKITTPVTSSLSNSVNGFECIYHSSVIDVPTFRIQESLYYEMRKAIVIRKPL